MKYIINYFGELLIINDSDNQIFLINKINQWYKFDYDQHGNRLNYENYTGRKFNY